MDRTAMNIKKPAPGVRWLIETGRISTGSIVYDFGAGYGRNATYLRSLGIETRAYDPFHGEDWNGWLGVSNRECTRGYPINIILTSYVLNVLHETHERDVLENLTDDYPQTRQYHITRNEDLVEYAAKHFPNENPYRRADRGFVTKRGFQRRPWLSQYGFDLIKCQRDYCIWTKEVE